MWKCSTLLAALLLAASTPAYANWGSIAGGSVASGNFHSFGTEQIEMRRENLHIRLFRDRAKVEVSYILHNTGPVIDVRAAFQALVYKPRTKQGTRSCHMPFLQTEGVSLT